MAKRIEVGRLNQSVIGLGFGDEGKGRIVDYLCSKNSISLVVRYSGGHQSGHHVVAEGFDHVFSNFGSGSLRGVPTYWSPYCTVDPIGLRREYSLLRARGVEPLIYIDERCPVTLGLDKLANIENPYNIKHGTCGVGFGTTLQRHESNYKLCFGDLGFPSVAKVKYNRIREYYMERGVRLSFPRAEKEPVDEILEAIELECIRPTIGIPGEFAFEPLLFEGSQGLLLDKDIGFFPNVTRANVGTKNILKLNPSMVSYLHLVTRAYQTRHGNGPMTNTDIPNGIKYNPYERNDALGHQGKFRISLLDLDLLEYAVRSDSIIRSSLDKTLYITCMDLVEDDLRLTHKGETLGFSNEDDFVNKISETLGFDRVKISKSPMGSLETNSRGESG